MTTNEMITELTQTVSMLKKDVDYLYTKLEKAYDDRIQLRAENERLKKAPVTVEEEECISCSA